MNGMSEVVHVCVCCVCMCVSVCMKGERIKTQGCGLKGFGWGGYHLDFV